MNANSQPISPNDIAIIGMSGQFPGADSIETFWQNLRDGVEAIVPLSDEQLEQAGISADTYNQPNYVKAAPLLDRDIGEFDAAFFGFSPREAALLDPQQRWFLEGAWEALERSGYPPQHCGRRAGVFAGVGCNTYLLFNLYPQLSALDASGAFQTLISNDKDFLTTRVSYLLNLNGASVTVQTACSTSLVAIHMACQSLLSGENDLALAGGVSLKVPQGSGYFYQEGGIHSPDGHCRSFDAQAKGTVGGSGLGIIVLKRLDDAIADGDQIAAVIKGSAINNDGAMKVGYTAPSVSGQADAIAEALAVADVAPETINYVETHGTATPLGDPIEIQALTRAFQTQTQQTGFCAIGSVKSNVGHLDAAAGVTGAIATVLALQHRQIPPSLHFERPNPEIPFDRTPFFVNTRLSPWSRGTTPRRAGVSSFGIGGTNAHAILEEAPPPAPTSDSRSAQLLLLSAKTETALEAATERLGVHLATEEALDLADAAYTLAVGREAFEYRRAWVCGNSDEAIAKLATPGTTHRCDTRDRPIAFLCSGQGTQYPNMTRDLYESEPVFREAIDRCAVQLQSRLHLDIRDLLYPDEANDTAAQLQQTAIAQPVLFALEYAMTQLWQSWGIEPVAVLGHSIGEYVAACLAGVFASEDALNLVAERGRLMQDAPPGAMLSVAMSADAARSHLTEELVVAAINAPSLCAVSGTERAIAQLQAKLEAEGIACRRLRVSHAFHSPMMAAAADEFTKIVETVSLKPPQLPIVSNLTGEILSDAEATDPEYWSQHLRQPVRFADGVATLASQCEGAIWLEVGPGRTLATLAQQQQRSSPVLTSIPTPTQSTADVTHLLDTLAQLWLLGATVNWQGFYQHQQRRRVPLPTYPFERQRYWIDAQWPSPTRSPAPLEKNSNLDEWFYTPIWKQAPLTGTDSVKPGSRWLVFLDDRGLGESLVRELRAGGAVVTTVAIGTEFDRVGENAYVLDPSDRAAYEFLWQALQRSDRVVHLWSATAKPSLELGFYSLLYLVQAIGEDPATLSVVTQAFGDVTGSESRCPLNATLSGACRVIAQEYPHLNVRLFDVEISTRSPIAPTVQMLVRDLLGTTPDSPIAYRGNRRWIETFERVNLAADATTTRIKPGGTYLITGGLGGIGLSLARHFADTAKVNLILISRSPLPETGEKANAIRHLQSRGTEVTVIPADVGDREVMQRVIVQAESRFGKIDGVVHSAGIAGGGTIALKTRDRAAAVLHAKIDGTLVLDELLDDLDFMVLGSSISSVLGGFGQIDYCAANAFLDAFARDRALRTGQFTVSINWDTWQSVGMAVETTVPEALKQRRQANLERGIHPNEGIEAFRRILASDLPQAIVCTKSLDAAIERSRDTDTLERELAGLSAASPQPPAQSHPRPDLDTPYVAPRTDTERAIAQIWQELLGIEAIGVDDDFFELGGHSLLGTQIVSRLRDRFEGDVPLNRFFATPTIAGLAASLSEDRAAETDIQPVQRDDSEQLISQLDRLSEGEVDRLLGDLLAADATSDSHER